MEYLSLPHTRASTHRLVPEVNDTLLSNLRTPIMTLIEDTTPGAHDTLTAACDAAFYAELGVDKPEEHGSCAVNLVLALKELNETTGLKGTKAVGSDITVNIAPTPLHLFMNAPLDLDVNAKSEGSGAKGVKLSVEEPKGKKRSYVRFRAERDIVVVLSACPMDVGKQNGGKCMAANFMVEEADEEDMAASAASLKKKPKKLSPGSKKAAPKEEEKKEKEDEEKLKTMPRPRGGPGKIAAVMKSAERKPSDDSNDDPPDSGIPETPPGEKEEKPKPMPRPRGGPGKIAAVQKSAERKPSDDSNDDPPNSGIPETSPEEKKEDSKPASGESTPKAKKKPKKLERRTPAKSEAS
jgi:uncharacterized protein YcgI (DUF1989 family)